MKLLLKFLKLVERLLLWLWDEDAAKDKNSYLHLKFIWEIRQLIAKAELEIAKREVVKPTYSRNYHQKHASDAGGKIAMYFAAMLCGCSGMMLGVIYQAAPMLIISVIAWLLFSYLTIKQAKRFHRHFSRLS